MAVLLAYIAICLIWGSTWMVIKIGLRGAPPMTAVAVRFIIAAAVIYAIVSLRRIPLPKDRRFLVLGLFLGVFHFALPYTLVYWGEQRISSGLTAVLYATLPFMTALLARGMLGDPLGWKKVVGIVTGAAGVVVIFSDTISLGGTEAAFGVLAVLASVFGASLSSVTLKKFGRGYDPLVSLLIPFSTAALLVVLAAGAVERSNPLTYSATTWATILYLSAVGSVLAFALYFWIIQRMDVTALSYSTFIIPIIAVILGGIFLGESLSQRVAIGSLFVLAGILLAVHKRSGVR